MTESKRKKPTPNYGALALGDQAPAPSAPAPSVEIAAVAPAPASAARSSAGKRSAAGVGIRDRSKSVILYLNPRGHKALKQYGLDAERAMQDLILEALETWARSKGLTDPMRPSEDNQ